MRQDHSRHFSSVRADLLADGVALVRGLLDPADVTRLAGPVGALLADLDWAQPGSLRPGRCPRFGSDEFTAGYTRIQKLEGFHRLAWHPQLIALMSELLSGEVFAHPSRQLRITLPDAPGTVFHTRPHQDFPVYRVAADVLTAWVPLHACDDARSSLRVLGGSHREGYVRPASSGGERGVYVDAAADDPRWLRLSCEPGDVVIFHAFTVHGAGPNLTDLMRLSTVYRYQRCDDPVREELLAPHGSPGVPDWPALTAGWSSPEWAQVPPGVTVVRDEPGRPSQETLDALRAPASRLLGGGGRS